MPTLSSDSSFQKARQWGGGCLGALVCVLLYFWASPLFVLITQQTTTFLEKHFVLEDISIQGTRWTSRQDIFNAMRLKIGEGLWRINVHAIKENLEALPWVASARVQRVFPNRLTIHVCEFKPFALWRKNGQVFTVDKQGHVICARFPGAKELFVLIGADAPRGAYSFLQNLRRADGRLIKRIHTLHRLSSGRWDVYLKDGPRLRFPRTNLLGAVSRLRRLEKKMSLRTIFSVDLRLEDRVVLTP